MKINVDIVIVGSGAGGSTVGRELAISGKKVLIVEKGSSFSQNKLGTELNAFNFYDKHGLWSKSKEGVIYYRTIMAGGTTVVSCGNGVRSLENEFKSLGIDLTKEFLETERELNIKPTPDKFIKKGTRRIMEASNRLGFDMKPMPKFIDFAKCVSCENCVLGCRANAKWTALQYLEEAQRKGASFIKGITITNVMISNGKAIGVEGCNPIGDKIKIFANIIVLAAGGIGTPVILQNSEIKAGQKLFLDLFKVTIGLTKDVGLTKQPVMAVVNFNNGFILSPFIDTPIVLASVIPKRHILKITQRKHMLGIMVKIKDDCLGKVHKDGAIEKIITLNDLSKLNKGVDFSKKILIDAGVSSKTIVTTKVRGGHPGGTASIGEVIDHNLETEIKNLFVCDASVFPTSPGLPPIITIIALSKRLAKYLNENYIYFSRN